MVMINRCEICHTNTTGSAGCLPCTQAVWEDRFATLQRLYHGGKLNVDDRTMEQFLRTGKFRTLDEYKKTLAEKRFQEPSEVSY